MYSQKQQLSHTDTKVETLVREREEQPRRQEEAVSQRASNININNKVIGVKIRNEQNTSHIVSSTTCYTNTHKLEMADHRSDDIDLITATNQLPVLSVLRNPSPTTNERLSNISDAKKCSSLSD